MRSLKKIALGMHTDDQFLTLMRQAESDRAGIWLYSEYVLLPEDRHLQLVYVCACIRGQEGIYKSAPELVRPVSDRDKERRSVDL